MASTSDVIKIRTCTPKDHATVLKIYPRAFPGEDLVPLVQDLFDIPQGVFSFVAEQEDVVVAHVMMSLFGKGDVQAALLGSVAVDTPWQGQGVGSKLIHSAIDDMKVKSIGRVFVLGDPSYYGRFGFVAEKT